MRWLVQDVDFLHEQINKIPRQKMMFWLGNLNAQISTNTDRSYLSSRKFDRRSKIVMVIDHFNFVGKII